MAQQLPNRLDLNEKETWNLALIYQDDASWEKDFDAVESRLPALADLSGELQKSGADLLRVMTTILATYRQLEKLYVYASMKSDQDTANQTYQALDTRAGSLLAKVSAATAFFEPELLELQPEQLEQFKNDEPGLADYAHYLEKTYAKKAHTLSAEQEGLLAGAGEIFGASQKTFSVLDNADLKFGEVTDEAGDRVELSNGLYSRLLESTQPAVRQEAFETLYDAYMDLDDTFASTLSSHVKGHNYLAQVHHYPSARAAALSSNEIPESVFDMLVEQVHEHLPLLHRYVALRKQVLNLEELHSYDLYTPLVGEMDYPVDYQMAQATILKALAPLGDEYLEHVQEALDNRWIDVPENRGKRSGAYSGGAYDTAPYILLNWQDNLNNIYTLIHEMGHSMHSLSTRSHQPYQYGDYPIFLAEIASTTNEFLLTDYLLKTQTDSKIRAYVLNQYLDSFKGTVFRQTQFAEFEHWLHQTDAQGEALTAESLANFYGQLNQDYYGPALTVDPQIAYEWARIPHFYYNYYVYQYATGEAAATALGQGLIDDPKRAEMYRQYLASGSSDYPIEVMKHAGVDMTQPDYLKAAFKVFENRLDELETLLKNGL